MEITQSYTKPKNLLTFDNAKTIKGEKYNYKTAILYLSPHKQNSLGKNICSHASKAYIFACLNKAGRGVFNSVQNARINKTEYFLQNRVEFMMQIDLEIFKLSKKHSNLVVRLNGTSDIPFESIKALDGTNIFEQNKNVQFYDYTKNYSRFDKNQIANYHLTFSLSEEETNKKNANWIYNQGLGNVAIVISETLYKDLFKNELKELEYSYKGKVLRLFNGDLSDLRFLDNKNSLVCLKAKGLARKDTSGFVLNSIEEIYSIFK